MTGSRRVSQVALLAGLAAIVAVTSAAVADTSPYASWQGREIKALSPERAADLLAGRGAGYALAAELNGYPGPRHVLDLADELGLSPAQRSGVQALFDAMQAEARALGGAVVQGEASLDLMFARRHATAEALDAAVAAIAGFEGRLRAVHLRYHLETAAILGSEQIARYVALRGYVARPSSPTEPAHGHGHKH
jgi:hypothetical protein